MPPVPAPTTIHVGTGCCSHSSCAKIDSAMLLLPRQSVARSAIVNWSMKWPPSSSASRCAASYTWPGLSTKWQRPPWRSMRAVLVGEVPLVITATNGTPISLAKYASLTAVDPDDASITVVFSVTQPLQIAYRNSDRASRCLRSRRMGALVLQVQLDPGLSAVGGRPARPRRQLHPQQVGVGAAPGIGLDEPDGVALPGGVAAMVDVEGRRGPPGVTVGSLARNRAWRSSCLRWRSASTAAMLSLTSVRRPA